MDVQPLASPAAPATPIWKLPPLHWAAFSSAVKAVRAALDAGADARQTDAAGNTALGYVFNPPFIPGARTMFHDATPRNQANASAQAVRRTLKLLLAAGADPNATHSPVSAPDFMARASQPEAGCQTVRRAAPGLPAIPILHLAACCDDAALLSLLLRAGADPAALLADGRTALDLAHLYGCSASLIAVLRQAGVPRSRPDTLAQLARHGDLACVTAMLRAGARPDTPEPDLSAQRIFYPNGDMRSQAVHGHYFPAPRTMLEFPLMPLMQAVAGGHGEIAIALLDAGAEPCSRTMREAGLLGWAARQGLTELCIRLVQHGWDPNGCSGDQHSPLSLAVRQHPATARALLHAGAAPDGNPANANDFPLSHAVAAAREDSVAMLLNAGANLRGRDHRKSTALKALKQSGAPRDIKARMTALLTHPQDAAKPEPEIPPILDPAFRDLLAWIEAEFGAAPRPWRRNAGVHEFPGKDQALLDAVRRGAIARGYFAAFGKIARNGTIVSVRIYPSCDPYAALRACGTSGNTHGRETEEIIAWLTDLARLHPFDLEACDTDFVFGRFRAPIGEAALFLAKRMMEFCPGLKTFQDPLARDMQQKGVFYFWWD